MVTQVPDKVQACSGVSFDFYDCASGKRLLDGEAARFAAHTRDKEPALTQRATFVGDYQFAVRAVATALIGQLNQKDILHTVAAQYGLGDKVPAIGTLLKQYERRFSYSLESPRGWTDLKYTSKYNAGVFPKKDGNVVSVVLSVDLLLDAFGNNVSTVEEYQRVWLERVAAAGFAVETTAPFTGLTLPAGWLGFSIATKDRQGRLVELMHVSNAVVFDLELVFVKQYDEYFAKYREDMQSIVANSAFEASAD